MPASPTWMGAVVSRSVETGKRQRQRGRRRTTTPTRIRAAVHGSRRGSAPHPRRPTRPQSRQRTAGHQPQERGVDARDSRSAHSGLPSGARVDTGHAARYRRTRTSVVVSAARRLTMKRAAPAFARRDERRRNRWGSCCTWGASTTLPPVVAIGTLFAARHATPRGCTTAMRCDPRQPRPSGARAWVRFGDRGQVELSVFDEVGEALHGLAPEELGEYHHSRTATA